MNRKILIVEDDADLREAILDTLAISGFDCDQADCAEKALLMLNKHSYSMVISDVQMPGQDGLSLLKSIKAKSPELPVLLMTAFANIKGAVEAMKDGAVDYLTKPFSPEVLINLVSRYILPEKNTVCQPIVRDPQSIQLLNLAKRVAQSEASVMVLGPSGSGKEVLARYIHQESKRAEQPFVAINCAAIPENMLEATLFGYEKGAFTGALQACPGKFEQAQGGTILLDEISEMDLALQAKLLRVIQEREVERLGGRKTIKLDVRVIATSNRDLKSEVGQGHFREDLYYRLNVFPLTWLPLSERKLDILPLVEHLIERHCQQSAQPIPKLSMAARSKLQQHDWPGNVRELDNVVQRALILSQHQVIDEADILIETDTAVMAKSNPQPQASGLGKELKEQEHQIILDTLIACHGKRNKVADKLGISPRTLRYKLAKMREMGIEIPV
ncbi:two component, sigma54 specific, transcriptional regulator, Fis family protein [Catenovulum agarivorans DS-2]|uniref:Two component, sigma54 specific, transcriptional regulator, Fis family protein n=1 Tax=Catenovulum agarivorans DS-2 TaxID=1328313 RepID=W7QP77_9ALTE|nr:sigma-54 dependent transcriptional regulator [Catenovulum agarivorans]EWH09688.1 two component, sigma54 specific, transcriptional regulator, Fis family protein [Catenovulum agarivorans DS-2]